MNNQFKEEQEKLMEQFEKGVNVVLSTSVQDFITSRTVTVIPYKNSLYITSIRRPGAMKNEQIEKNPNIAICWNTMQITGKATITGLVTDEINYDVMKLYQEKLPESYQRFAVIPSAEVIKIDIFTCKSWKMANNHVESTSFNFDNQTVEKNII